MSSCVDVWLMKDTNSPTHPPPDFLPGFVWIAEIQWERGRAPGFDRQAENT